MNELNRIRIARLNEITKANKAKEVAIKTANETARKDCIKRLKEYWIPRMAEIGEVSRAYAEAFPDTERITIPLGGKERFEQHWLDRTRGFAVYDGENYYYTLLQDGRFVKHCHYACSEKNIPLTFENMWLGLATQFLDGFERWEQELYRRIDSSI